MKKIIFIVVFLIFFPVGIWLGYKAATGPTEIKQNFGAKDVTEKQFEKVTLGMSFEEVENLLGKPKTINTKITKLRDEAWYYDMKLERPITVKGGASLSTIPVEITFKSNKVNNIAKAQF